MLSRLVKTCLQPAYTVWGKAFAKRSRPTSLDCCEMEPCQANPLEEYFDSHTQGACIRKWRHYFEIYHRHFRKFVGQNVHVLEIGIYSGGSLEMWRSYFGPQARIYGVDIEEACRA